MREIKQFMARSYYDKKYRGLEDSETFDKDDDMNGWIWQKACEGNYVIVEDRETGDETYYRPVEPEDIDIEDLVI